jgi:hypothetical protein
MKDRGLIVLIIVLAIINLGLYLWEPGSQSLTFNPQKFQINDTSSVENISFTSNSNEIEISRTSSGWKLNDSLVPDKSILRVFLSVMSRVSIRRILNSNEYEELASRLPVSGINVRIRHDNGTSEFEVLGSRNLTQTYFIGKENNTAYEVEIPGYSDYLGGIFNLTKDQWRDRRVFSGNWRTIQSIELDYAKEQYDDLKIYFEGDFFKVEGLNEIDSNQVVAYFDQFLNLQANEMIALENYPEFDSLVNTPHFLKMTIDDINLPSSLILNVYPPVDNGSILLVTANNGSSMVFDRKRLENFFAQPVDFQYQRAN